MKTLFTLAWRNIWRHPGRSGVLLAAIIAGLWAGVVTVGTMNGMLEQRVNYLIESEITHLQVHHPEFRVERRPTDYIPEAEQITNWLEGDERVAAWSPRVIAEGMVQSPVKSSGVRIRGIDIEKENRTTTFHENMVEGDYIDVEIRNPVIIGKALAGDHNLRIGNRIVLTFEDLSGDLTSASFNISGFFRSASTDYDETNVFVRSDDLKQLLGSDAITHEIAVLLHDVDDARAVAAGLNEEFTDIEARTWTEISPELSTLVQLGGLMLYVVTGIIMLALAFGILNTMLMALFERLREIGMLISIGMSRARVFVMIMMEAVMLTLAGAGTGILLAWLSIGYLGDSGVNFGRFAEGIAEIGWDPVVYPSLSANEYIAILAVVIVISLGASLYPAIKAIRINPLEEK
ncbi:MAG: FtsX-like permease family protein [Balneolia bacterium]|nr:FtsX-like permease family protein [Balneolia bacterium]